MQGFQGVVGVQGFQGTIGNQGFQGLQGSQGIDGPQGLQGYLGASGLQGTIGLQGEQGEQGNQGHQGEPGGNTAQYQWSNSIVDADPGSGFLRFNHAVVGSATKVYIDDVDRNSVDRTFWIDSFDDEGASSVRGMLRVWSELDTSVFAVYKVTGSVTLGSGYRKLTVTHVTSNGSFINGDDIGVSFAHAGPSVGSQGFQGEPGDTFMPGTGSLGEGLYVLRVSFGSDSISDTPDDSYTWEEVRDIRTLVLTTPNTPPQITSNQNDYAPGPGSFQRWSSDASRDVTGMVPGEDGEIRQIWNVGTQNIVLRNNTTSTVGYRWLTTTGADFTLTPNNYVWATYDAASGYWRVG